MTLIEVACKRSGKERRRVIGGCPQQYLDEIESACPKHEDGSEYSCDECWSREFVEPEADEATELV